MQDNDVKPPTIFLLKDSSVTVGHSQGYITFDFNLKYMLTPEAAIELASNCSLESSPVELHPGLLYLGMRELLSNDVWEDQRNFIVKAATIAKLERNF